MKQEIVVNDECWNTDSKAYEMLARFIVKNFVKTSNEVQEDVQAV